jgi:hypothetical protein
MCTITSIESFAINGTRPSLRQFVWDEDTCTEVQENPPFIFGCGNYFAAILEGNWCSQVLDLGFSHSISTPALNEATVRGKGTFRPKVPPLRPFREYGRNLPVRRFAQNYRPFELVEPPPTELVLIWLTILAIIWPYTIVVFYSSVNILRFFVSYFVGGFAAALGLILCLYVFHYGPPLLYTLCNNIIYFMLNPWEAKLRIKLFLSKKSPREEYEAQSGNIFPSHIKDIDVLREFELLGFLTRGIMKAQDKETVVSLIALYIQSHRRGSITGTLGYFLFK